MSEVVTKYLPAAWLDEVIPAAQVHPNNFIFHSDALGWHLRDPEEIDEADPEDSWFMKLEAGKLVPFQANRVFGDFVLTVEPDGSFSTDRPVPAEANCFRVNYDTDTLHPSLAELVKGDGSFGTALGPGRYDVDAYWWSNEEYLFRFEIIDDQGVFHGCGVRQ